MHICLHISTVCMYACMHACIYIYTYVHVRICIWPGFHGEHFFKINQGILQYQISGQHLISFRAGLRQGTYSAVKGLELEEVQTMLRCHAQNFGWMNFSIWPILRSFLGYFNCDHPSTNPKGMDGVHWLQLVSPPSSGMCTGLTGFQTANIPMFGNYLYFVPPQRYQQGGFV